MPHHNIIRPEWETTEYRIVFDASAKTEKDVSLNDYLETGPALLTELVSSPVSESIALWLWLTFGKCTCKWNSRGRSRCLHLSLAQPGLGCSTAMNHANSDSTFWSKIMSLFGNSNNKTSHGQAPSRYWYLDLALEHCFNYTTYILWHTVTSRYMHV